MSSHPRGAGHVSLPSQTWSTRAAVVGRGWTAAVSLLDRYRYLFLGVCAGLYIATTRLRAAATPFWHDEIYTVVLSRLSLAGDIWRASRAGVDLAPPLNLYLTRLVESIGGVGPVSSRIPAMMGFLTMSVIVFRIVRARSNVVVAAAAMLLPWFTQAYRYGYEARAYGVMMGLFALLTWSWLEAAAGRRRRLFVPLVGILCAASIWNHYFAIVTFAPILCGELWRAYRSRAPDWPLWTSAACGGIACLPLVQIVRRSSSQGATFWHHANWSDISSTYWFLFHDVASMTVVVGIAVALAAAGAAFRGPGDRPRVAPGYEVIAGAAALALPLLSVALGRATGVFTPRYALVGIAPVVIVAPLMLWWISGRSRLLEAWMLIALACGVIRPSVEVLRYPPVFEDPVLSRPALLARLGLTGPVVVAGPVQFLQIWFYAPPDLRARLTYVADPARALKHIGSDTVDRGYLGLARWAPLHLTTLAQLESSLPASLYDDGSGWLAKELPEIGAVFDVEGTERGSTIGRVSSKPIR